MNAERGCENERNGEGREGESLKSKVEIMQVWEISHNIALEHFPASLCLNNKIGHLSLSSKMTHVTFGRGWKESDGLW